MYGYWWVLNKYTHSLAHILRSAIIYCGINEWEFMFDVEHRISGNENSAMNFQITQESISMSPGVTRKYSFFSRRVFLLSSINHPLHSHDPFLSWRRIHRTIFEVCEIHVSWAHILENDGDSLKAWCQAIRFVEQLLAFLYFYYFS